MISFLRSRAYTVLNLIEVRKRYQEEGQVSPLRVGSEYFEYWLIQDRARCFPKELFREKILAFADASRSPLLGHGLGSYDYFYGSEIWKHLRDDQQY